MEVEVQAAHLAINVTKKWIVKAANYPFSRPKTLALSNLDLLSGRFPISYFYLYQNPENVSFQSIILSLTDSLAEVLSYFYPFSGQIVQNSVTVEPKIACDNSGALLVEGHANTSLEKIDLHHLDQIMEGKLLSVHQDFPLQVQATRFTCGGVCLTFTFDHALGDASSFAKFLLSWSEIAQQKPISCTPDHRRNLLPRCPPVYDLNLDQSFVKCTMEEIKNIPTPYILLKRLYHIDVSCINKLQQLACANGHKRSKIEAFSAHVWKIMVKAIDKKYQKCKMGWLVDGRSRMSRTRNSMSNYIGNFLSVAVGEASVEELKQGSISDISSIVHEAISKVSNEEHFLDLIDWVECHRPGLMMSNIVLGRGGPALVVSSGRRFPVSELDFGFGSPVLGSSYSTIEKSGVSYMNQRPSARKDGSWTVSTILWPELASALESDPVFQPMSPKHLEI